MVVAVMIIELIRGEQCVPVYKLTMIIATIINIIIIQCLCSHHSTSGKII